jgi:hypothetical protein
VLHSAGLRVSLAGAVIFVISVVALIFVPAVVAITGLLAGGMAVWGGFIWTLLSYYQQAGNGSG